MRSARRGVGLEKEEGLGMKQRFYLCLVILLFPVIAWADSSALIIQGVGGSEQLEKKFEKWGASTRDVLVQDLGFNKDRVILLAGEGSKKAAVEQAFGQLKQTIKKDDTFLLFLIGHGSFDTDYKLNIFGPDLTGKEYNALIDSMGAARIVIVSSTASSGGMFETMAGKNRVLVAASRSGEKEDTAFYEYFLQGLKGVAADEDKDKKISAWEAFKYATAGVERFYKEQTRIQTEHGGLSAGSAASVTATASDQDVPILARVTSLNADRAITVADPKLQALLNERKSIEQKIEAHRLDKALLPEAEYDKRLEELIIELAKKNQEIQEQQKK
jgi:Peptidase C13 family